jgi:hypothetical protein
MDDVSIVLLIFGFLISWLITWLIIVRPICNRLDRIIMRLANLDEKTEGEQVYKIPRVSLQDSVR